MDALEKLSQSSDSVWAVQEQFQQILSESGSEFLDYPWSGYVLVTLLPYLQQKCQIDLMRSAYEKTLNEVGMIQENTIFALTETHKALYLEKLDPGFFSKSALNTYFNEFNRTNETGIGEAMLAGITAIRDSLRQIDDNSVVVLSIG